MSEKKKKDVYSYNDKGMLLNGKLVMNKPLSGTLSRESYDKEVAEWKRKESIKKYKKATKHAVPIKNTPSKDTLRRRGKLKTIAQWEENYPKKKKK